MERPQPVAQASHPWLAHEPRDFASDSLQEGVYMAEDDEAPALLTTPNGT